MVSRILFNAKYLSLCRKYEEKHLEEGTTKDGNKFVRIWLRQICVIVLVIVLGFRLVPASMTWFGLPYYLFWMRFAVEALMYNLYWWCIVLPYCNNAITNANIKRPSGSDIDIRSVLFFGKIFRLECWCEDVTDKS